MRNKHLLLFFVAMLGLAFVYPTSLSAQKDKKKKEKKELIWELPEPSGDPTIDGYLLSCDTLYHKISTYRDSLSHYKYQEASFSVGGKNYLFKCMIDSVNNQFLSYGMGRWQVAQGIMTGAEIILDATSLSLNTASAALALPNLKLKAIKYFKPVKDLGPHVIGMDLKEIPAIKKECQNTMRKYGNAKKAAILPENIDPAVREHLMAELGIDANTFEKWYYKYIFVNEDIQEAAEGTENQVVEKTEEEKDAGNKLTDYKNFGVADLPEGQAEPSAVEEMNLLS